MISSHRQNRMRRSISFHNSILLPILIVLALHTPPVTSNLIPKGPFKGEEKIPLTLRQESQTHQPPIATRQAASRCTLCIDGSDPSLLDKEITREDVPLPDCASLAGALNTFETDSDECRAAQSSLGVFCGCPIPEEACTLCADGTSVPSNSHDALTSFDAVDYIPGASADTSMTCLAMESYLLVRVNNTDPVCQSTKKVVSNSGLCGCGEGHETNETSIKCCQESEPSEMECGRSGCRCCGDGNWLLGNSGPTLTIEAACRDLLPSIPCEKKEGDRADLQETLLSQLVNLVPTDSCQDEMDRLEACLGSTDCDSNSNCVVADFVPNEQSLGEFSSDSLEVVANTTATNVCQQISNSFCETVDCCTSCFSQVLSYSECQTKIYNEGLTEAITGLFSSEEVPSEIFQCIADNFVCQQTVDDSDETGFDEEESSGLPVCQERENILLQCLGEKDCENDCPGFFGEQNYTAEALALIGPNYDPSNFDYVANLTVLVNQITCEDSQRELCRAKTCCSGCAQEFDSYFGCSFVTSQSSSKIQLEAAIGLFEISGLATEGTLKIPELPQCTVIDEEMCQENITLPQVSNDDTDLQSTERTGRPVLVNSSFIIAVKEIITADILMPDGDSMNLPLFMLEEAYARLVQRVVAELLLGDEENLDGNTPANSENGTATSTTLVDGASEEGNVTATQRNGGQRVLRKSLQQLHGNLELARPMHNRRLVVSLDTNSAELYRFLDTPCPVSDATVERQAPSLSNCIVVFGNYRVYVGEDDNVEQTYIDFASASQGLIALGGLEDSLLEGDKREIDFRVVEAYSPVVDNNFDAFSELTVDTSPPKESNTTVAPSMTSTTAAPSMEKTQSPVTPTMQPVVDNTDEDKSSVVSFTIGCGSLLLQVFFLQAFAPMIFL